MPRPKSKTTIQQVIEAQERKLLAGISEAVLVGNDDLASVAILIESLELTKAQVLRKAVHLGIQVLLVGTRPTVKINDFLPTAEPEAFTAPYPELLFDAPDLSIPNMYTNTSEQGGWQFHGAAQAPPEETE